MPAAKKSYDGVALWTRIFSFVPWTIQIVVQSIVLYRRFNLQSLLDHDENFVRVPNEITSLLHLVSRFHPFARLAEF